MTHARSRWTGGLNTAAILVAVLSPAPAWASLDVDTLMSRLAAHGGGEIGFTEERESGLLTEKLMSRGTLVFRPPDYLEKRVLEPRPERFEVRGGQLTIDSGQKKARELRLDDFAPLRAMVEAFRAALAGDRATLERYFTLSLEGDEHAWRLRLEPRDQLLRERVSAVVLRGKDDVLREIETLERGGDRALMRLGEPDRTPQ